MAAAAPPTPAGPAAPMAVDGAAPGAAGAAPIAPDGAAGGPAPIAQPQVNFPDRPPPGLSQKEQWTWRLDQTAKANLPSKVLANQAVSNATKSLRKLRTTITSNAGEFENLQEMQPYLDRIDNQLNYVDAAYKCTRGALKREPQRPMCRECTLHIPFSAFRESDDRTYIHVCRKFVKCNCKTKV